MSLRLREMALKVAGALSAAGVLFLAGCGAGSLAGPSAIPGFKINGNVHGGPYPIQGATIRLMETQSTGTWSTTTNSYSGTAKQLLQTTSDNLGYFTFPDTGWTCDAGQYAYITVSGGHTTAAVNSNVVQVGVIGGCSADLATKSEIDNVNVYISELSTVAAAYAMGNFMTIDDNSSAGAGLQKVNITSPANNNSTAPGCTGTGNTGNGAMACKQAGLANAFANAYNLVDQVTYGANQFPTGAARTAVPGNAQSIVPQALINTLGNILQSCVDSAGGTVTKYSTYVVGDSNSTHCGDLFYLTTPSGSTTSPTNTLQAALNMARNPANNVDALFKLQPRAVFFTPDMTSDTFTANGTTQTMALSLSIFYPVTGLTAAAGSVTTPVDVALDEADNAYVLYTGTTSAGAAYGAVNEFQPNGMPVFTGAQVKNLASAASMALDSNGNLFATNDTTAGTGDLFQLYTSGSNTLGSVNQRIPVAGNSAAGLAIDMSNNVWVARDSTDGNQSLFRFDASNSYASTSFNTTPNLGGVGASRIFVDYRQNVLGITNSTSAKAQVFLFPYNTGGAGTAMHFAALSAKNGFAVTMSNADTFYAPLYQQLNTETGFTNGQMSANGAGSYTGSSTTGATYNNPMGVSMDGSGNLFWTDYETAGQLFWFTPSSTTSVSNGTLVSLFPCYPYNGQCVGNVSSNLRGLAIDSSGAIWYVADSSIGVLIQTLGMAAPSYPLQSYARNGVIISD